MKFSNKLSLTIFITGIVVLIIASFAIYGISYKAIIKIHLEDIKSHANIVSEEIDHLLSEKVKIARTLANSPVIKEALKKNNLSYLKQSNEERNESIKLLNEKWNSIKDPMDNFILTFTDNKTSHFLKNQLALIPGEYGEIFLTNKFGALVASTSKLSTFAHGHKYWWLGSYNKGEGAVFFDDRGYDDSVGGYVLGLVVPIKEGTEILGILKCNLNILGGVSELISDAGGKFIGKFKLIRSGGMIVFEKGFEPLSTQIHDEIFKQLKSNDTEAIIINDPGEKHIVGFSEIKLTNNEKEYGFGGTFESIDHKKGNTGESWYILCYRQMSSIQALIIESIKWIVLIGAIIIFILVLAAFLFGRKIAKPLAILSTATEKVGSGDFKYRIDYRQKDEFGSLTESFNDMADMLQKTTISIDRLENEVADRKQAERQLKLEHSRLMSILESIPYGVYIVDQYFNIEYVNPVIKKEFGTIQGRKCYQYFHERTKVCPWCKNKEVFAGKSVNWRWYSSRADKYFELFDSPFKNPDGSISKFEIFQDITDRKKAEEALQKSEEKYRSMMDAMDEATYICSPDFRIEYMNPAMIKRAGYDASGESCHKVIHGLDEKCPWCVFKKIIGGESINHEIVSPKDNHIFYISNSPIFYKNGSVSKLTICRDVTRYKKLETQLQQAQKMESIGTLAGGIAHDFNNILFPVLGYTEMLMEDVPEDSPFRDSLNEIYTGSLRARELVKQILTFSRQESGELKLMKIQHIVKEALKLIRSTIPTTIEIKLNINAECGVIKADPTKIHQIIMNLTTNAYHAMENSGGELKVSLNEIRLGELDIINPDMTPGVYACLTIADTGKGMNKELTKKIFDPFFTTKGKGKGTGMGLSVVHGIVKNLGGAIHVYSEPGKGTKFHIYLPVIENSSEKQEIQAKELIQGGIEKVLLVDDEEAILTMEKLMLERLGYQVSSCTSSIDALETFRDNPDKFDLVITDMAMPNMSGDKLSAELIKIRSEIPTLLCTGFSETISEEKAASLGIKGFLLKPIVMKDFSQKIREVLDKN
jgi:PAS domain S-box-containing protein